jgi:hypothetical protein
VLSEKVIALMSVLVVGNAFYLKIQYLTPFLNICSKRVVLLLCSVKFVQERVNVCPVG